MGEALQARQAKKAACALDRVNKPENQGQGGPIVRIAFEFHQLGVNGLEMFGRFDNEVAQKIIHRGHVREGPLGR